MGATVVGVSPDQPATLLRFQAEQQAPQWFVSDPDKRIAKSYQALMHVGSGGTTMRISFVINREGTIVYNVYDWSPLTNVNTLYRWLKEHPQA